MNYKLGVQRYKKKSTYARKSFVFQAKVPLLNKESKFNTRLVFFFHGRISRDIKSVEIAATMGMRDFFFARRHQYALGYHLASEIATVERFTQNFFV